MADLSQRIGHRRGDACKRRVACLNDAVRDPTGVPPPQARLGPPATPYAMILSHNPHPTETPPHANAVPKHGGYIYFEKGCCERRSYRLNYRCLFKPVLTGGGSDSCRWSGSPSQIWEG